MVWTAPARRHRSAIAWSLRATPQREEPSMTKVITIGLDLGKNVFQVHGVDASGAAVLRRRLRRGEVLGFFAKLEPATVGIEACATAHHWGRALAARGHTVRLMPARYVKAYVKRQKNDASDAAAICEAVTRPTICLLYTSDAADERSSVDLGGRRIIKK